VRSPIELPGTLRQRLLVGVACAVALAALIVGLATRKQPPNLPSKQERPARVSVPDVIGDSATTATHKLGSRGLGARFTVLGGPGCVGLPRTGHIVNQHPLSGAKVARHSGFQMRTKVSLQTSCPKVVPPCQPNQIAIKTRGGESDITGTGGARVIDVDLTHIAGPPCELDSTVSLQLLESDGMLAAIEGNPSSYSLLQKTGVGELVRVAWFLGGEIQPRRGLTVNARLDEWSATGRTHTPISDPHFGGLTIGRYTRALTTDATPRSYEAALATTRAYGP
jgi:hypothetical protein